MPWAEAIVDADINPKIPFRTSRVIALREKSVARGKVAKRKRLTMNIAFRPKRSAALPKKRRKEPGVKLPPLEV